jgi:hypothetical protein
MDSLRRRAHGCAQQLADPRIDRDHILFEFQQQI